MFWVSVFLAAKPDLYEYSVHWLLGLINDMYRLDEGVIESGVDLFLIVGHWLKIVPQNSK